MQAMLWLPAFIRGYLPIGKPWFSFGFLASLLMACGGEGPTEPTPSIAPLGHRSTSDRPAEVLGPQIHAIYLIPADARDRGMDTTGELNRSIAVFQAWLAGKTSLILREDTWGGQRDISFVRSAKTDAEIAEDRPVLRTLYREILRAGFTDPQTIYLIYYEGSSDTCGNAVQGGPVAALYLRGVADGRFCQGRFVSALETEPRYWEFAMLHEVMHTLGLVDPTAPNHAASSPGHVWDQADLMHAGGGGWAPKFVDRDNDDYFGHLVPAGVRNLKDHPIMMFPSSGLARARVTTGESQVIGPFPHEVILLPQGQASVATSSGTGWLLR